MTRVKEHSVLFPENSISDLRSLIMYNDDVNTFDFIIESLIEVCSHDEEQAEQCALIAHFNGKCEIKKGAFFELKPMHDELSNRQISVTISK